MAIKTDAPEAFVWDFMRCWAREVLKPQQIPTADDGTPRSRILMRPPATTVDIKAAAAAERVQKPAGPRFLPNPRENWGPGSRAGRKRTPKEKAAKRAKREEADSDSSDQRPPKQQCPDSTTSMSDDPAATAPPAPQQ